MFIVGQSVIRNLPTKQPAMVVIKITDDKVYCQRPGLTVNTFTGDMEPHPVYPYTFCEIKPT
jgi:hypothetical protein